MTRDELASIIGDKLADDLAPKQRDEVAAAAQANPNGVARLADRVLADYARGTINAAVPVLLSRIRNGKHNANLKAAATRTTELGVVAYAEQRYHARIAKYPDWGHDDAIEYAVDFTVIDHKQNTMTSAELEAALRRRLGRTPAWEDE